MLLLSWNVNRRLPGDLAAKIKSVGPDIVTLQEVHRKRKAEWVAHLQNIGLAYAYWSRRDDSDMRYGCLMASHWKVAPVDSGWRQDAPYPELLGRATVSASKKGEIDMFTAHIPNGSIHGWKKIRTFDVLASTLREASDSPRILTGDFNEPRKFQSAGEIVTWRKNSIKWRNGVLAVLNGESQHGLRDAYRDCNGYQPPDLFTWKGNKGARGCYDHTFVSRHFEIVNCGYFHEWRKAGLSDHSPMWTELRLRTDLPELKQWADDCS